MAAITIYPSVTSGPDTPKTGARCPRFSHGALTHTPLKIREEKVLCHNIYEESCCFYVLSVFGLFSLS